MTKPEAIIAAKSLKAAMKQGRWRIRVWKDFGWNYCIESGDKKRGMVTVHPKVRLADGKTEFICLLGKNGAGEQLWHNSSGKRHRDPNAAVRASIRLARQVLDNYRVIVNTASQAAGESFICSCPLCPGKRELAICVSKGYSSRGLP